MSIKQSDTAFPQGVNQRRDCPSHIKGMKQEIFDCFKNCTGEVTSTDEELSFCKGLINPFQWMRKLTATRNGNTYFINTTPVITELIDGYRFCIQVDEANLDNHLIAINRIGSVELVYSNGNSVDADYIPANAILEIIYDASNNVFQVLKIGDPPPEPVGPTNIQIFNYNDPPTFTATETAVHTFWLMGGGGGGASVDGLSGSQGGGGGGEFLEVQLSLTASDTVQCTAGVNGGGSFIGNALPGGDSTVVYDGTTYTANGGGGGKGTLRTGGLGGTGGGASGGSDPQPVTTRDGGDGGDGQSNPGSRGGGGGSGGGTSGPGNDGQSGQSGGAGGDGSGGASGGAGGAASDGANSPTPTVSQLDSGGGGGGHDGTGGSRAGNGGDYGSGGGGNGDQNPTTGQDQGGEGIVVVLW